jgi:tripartite-type tricarboxylate transporter receptor subunit TctC
MPSIRIIAAVGVFVAATALAMAQDWPARPVTMVVPFAAGGEADVLGRLVAQSVSEVLGKPVVVENVAGAGGTTGALRVAKSAADGYQFMFAGRGQFVIQSVSKNPPYAAIDFAPVALVAETPILLIARHDLPAGNLAQFRTYAGVNQAKMQYGSPGAGSTPHLACVLLNAAIGIDVTHVPYRAGGLAMQDLLAGRIDYQCTSAATAVPQIESKKVNAIAILTKSRSPILPALASAHEQGLADFDAGVWYGLFFPKGTPAPIVQKLHDVTLTAMQASLLQERMKEISATVVTPERRSPEYLQGFVTSEIGKWSAAVKAAGVTAD